MPQPGEWTVRCPHCGAYPAPFTPQASFQSTDVQGQPRFWQGGTCPSCGGAVVAELEGSVSGSIKSFAPETIGDWDVAHLSDSVEKAWAEAISVYRVDAHRMAVVACGRTLEAAAEDLGITGGTLQKRIEKMQADGLITSGFKGAMDHVRLIRNVGAHAGKDVSKDSATGTMRFTQQALRLLFEVPAELQTLMGHPPELDEPEDEPGT